MSGCQPHSGLDTLTSNDFQAVDVTTYDYLMKLVVTFQCQFTTITLVCFSLRGETGRKL